jgi:hemoglobin-like flavoprotein
MVAWHEALPSGAGDFMMTPEQIDLVQSGFRQVAPMAGTVADIFYARLFHVAPETQHLFRGDMRRQGDKLMQALTVVVESLPRLVVWSRRMVPIRLVNPNHQLFDDVVNSI